MCTIGCWITSDFLLLFGQLDYHKDFEESKAKYTSVADPVLVKSQMEATKKVSLVNLTDVWLYLSQIS